MATIQYARLYPDALQLQAKDGHNLTAGWVEVYLAGTDDPAITYADFNGTRNPQRIIVDDNGRFCAIVDKSKAYRVEVYDADGMLQWTTEPVWCTGNAGAGMSVTRVVSTDGSIAVEENIDGSERTYDISIAPSDSDEFLEWIKCSEEDCGSTWHPVYQAGTMETEAGQGIKVHAGQLYHFTNTFYVDPDGTGINYDTFKVTMYCNDEIVDVRDFDIDSSLNDSVMCEFSTDLIPEADGVVYYKLTIPSTCEVTAEVQCHRIYSGINAVPDTCATKQWVQETFDYNMAEKISYSALEYNDNGDISGISGSAIAGGLDSAAVSAIASSYAESAISSISGWSGDFSSISSKIDWSSSGVFQPSGNYQTAGDYAYNSSLSSKVDQSAFEQCCNEVHSALDEKLDKYASGEFQPSGQYVYESAYSSFSSEVTNNISSLSSNVSGISADMSAYVPFSGLEGEGGRVTGISGSAIKTHEYTGINPVTVDNTADTISVEHRTLCVDSTMTAYTTGDSAVIGVNVAGLDISSKMDASASSLFYSTSNPSGFVDAASASAIASAYAESAASSKQDTLSFSYDDDKISAINGSALAGEAQVVSAVGTETAYTPDGVSDVVTSINGNYISALSADSAWQASYDEAGRELTSLASEYEVSSIASAYADSAASGKQDTLTFDWDADSAISSINGSALAGQGGGGGVESISADSNFTGDGSTGSPLGLSSQIATGSWTAGNSGFRTNIVNSNSDHFDFAIGKRPNATNTAWTWFGLAALRSADAYALSQCDFIFGSMAGANSANPGIVSGDLYGISAQAHSKGELRFSLKYPSAYINISSVGKYSPQVYAYAGDKSAYIKMSKRVGTASGNSSIYDRAVLDSTYLEFKKYYTGYIDTADTASGTSYLMTTDKMEASSIPYWNGKADSSALSSYVPYSSLEYNTASAISGINGSALAAGSTYSAGEGIDITDDVISVESPVDIVAGPGIVIDNPDGNTLRVSLREDYEEVLYAASTDAGTALSVNGYITLSESLTHFEKVKIYYALQQSWGGAVSHEIYKVSGDQRIVLEQLWFREQSGYNNYWQTITFSKYSDTNLTITLVDGSQRPLLQNSWGSTGLTLTVFKVVGIHRIANN